MKWIIMFLILFLTSCSKGKKIVSQKKDSLPVYDTVFSKKTHSPKLPKKYFNKRFREVTAEKIATNQFRIKGEGQIFEATFSWIVIDGHNELKSGFEMADAGAPAWGKFDFSFDVLKPNQNSTLTLLLFESSAMDGSRQNELLISLP